MPQNELLCVTALSAQHISTEEDTETYTQRGSTQHFTVYYGESLNALGPTLGPTLADAVLARCEDDYTALQNWFGGLTPAGLPFVIRIRQGNSLQGGHANCSSSEVFCDVVSNDLEFLRLLVVAEVDEVFMANQNAGWDCNASNGEGLSRVLAVELHPEASNALPTGAKWLDSDRPDWVSNNDPTAGTKTGYNAVSIGCSTLFLNYLHYELNFSWAQIIQAGGSTLAKTYTNLTGSTDAFTPFAELLAQIFPIGRPSHLLTDNPFHSLRQFLRGRGIDPGKGLRSIRPPIISVRAFMGI